MKLLFTSDWHLRSDQITNRLDDFQQLQIDTLKFIANLAWNKDAVIIHAGDIFHKSKEENMQSMINQVYEIFKDNNIYFIAGNHDLLYKQIDNFDKCNIGLLSKFENWNNKNVKSITNDSEIFYLSNGQSIELYNFNEKILNRNKGICVLHRYCEKDNLPEYINDGITAKLLLEKYDYDVFVVGDNHKAFEYEKDGRFVFNTGCITRQNLNEKDYQPSIILFNTETKSYEIILLPDCSQNLGNVFKEENLTEQIKRNSRIGSFIDMVGKGKKVSFSFESNLKNYCKENNISEDIINEIEEVL